MDTRPSRAKQAGERRVAFIGGPPGLYASRSRLEGFREAARDAGVDGDLVYQGDFSYEQGYAAALQMIADAEPPEAIIGANDETAIGALAALRQARMEVPERVSVAGMTDNESQQTAERLKEINRDKTVIVVEHDMTFVRELGVKVTCLHEGTAIAEGTIDQVSANQRVIEVYLGR